MSAIPKLRILLTDGIYVFHTFEFGRDIPFKVYKQDDTLFDFTGYTLVIRLLDDTFTLVGSDITPLSTTPASGTGTFEFSSTVRPSIAGYYYIEAKLTKSGEQLYAISDRILVNKSPE